MSINISIILIVTIVSMSSIIQGNSINSSSITITMNALPSQCETVAEKKHDLEWQKIVVNQWIRYRAPFLLVTTIGTYAYLWYQLYDARALLKDQQAWCNWKDHIDIDRFLLCNHNEMSKELLLDIQERYINNQNPSDYIVPLVSFLAIIEKEKQALETYLWWSKKFITSYARFIFPIDNECIKLASQALTRLKCIKKIFVTCLAERNTDNSLFKA